MAAWITIYLRYAPEPLTADAIQMAISPADWLTLGEIVGLEEDAVEVFMDGLVWSDHPLGFAPAGQRQVQIRTTTDAAEVAELIAELGEYSVPVVTPRGVRERLRDVRAIVSIEMVLSQLNTMNETVAFEIAYWLAETRDGVILSDAHLWFDHGENRWTPIED